VAGVAVELRRPDLDGARAAAADKDRLGDVVDVALKAVVRVGSDGERQHTALQRAHEGGSLEGNVEVEQLYARELEGLGDREEAQVERHVGAQEEGQYALDVEHGDGVEVVGQQVGRQLAQPDLAVEVEVGEAEEDVGGDAALNAGGDQPEVDPGPDGDLGVQGGLGSRRPGHRVHRRDEEAVEQARRVVVCHELDQAG